MASGLLVAHTQTAADAGRQIPNNAVRQLKPILAAKKQQRCVPAQPTTASSPRTRITSEYEHTSWEKTEPSKSRHKNVGRTL